MDAYKGTFLKKDGSERVMRFVRICDLPEAFLGARVSGERKSNNYSEGQELVFDLEADNFRTFNHETKVGELIKYEIEDSLFV